MTTPGTPLPPPTTLSSSFITPSQSEVVDKLDKKIDADTLELFAYLAMYCADPKSSLKYIEKFQQKCDAASLPITNQGYGRLFIYNDIMEVLSIIQCAKMEEDKADGGSSQKKVPPFSRWKTGQWEDMSSHIKAIYNNLKRKDASACIGDEADSAVNKELLQKPTRDNGFGDGEKKFYHVLRYYELHRVMSDYQRQLNGLIAEAFENGDEDKPLPVADAWVQQLLDDIESERDETMQNYLKNILDDGKLKSAKGVRKFFTAKAFSYERMYTKTIELFRFCTSSTIGRPVLFKVYCDGSANTGHDDDNAGDDKEEQDRINHERDRKALEKLERARRQLEEQTEDQFDKIIAVAKRAKRQSLGQIVENSSVSEIDDDDDDDDGRRDRKKPRRSDDRHGSSSSSKRGGRFLAPKQTARQIEFGDSQQIEDNDDVLSEPDRPRPQSRNATGTSSSFRSPSQSPGQRKKSQLKKYKGRRSWTDEEKNAIKDGARRLGIGNWAKIKEYHDEVLDMRTSGQIKDCWRSMANAKDDEVLAMIEETSGDGNEGGE
mmetsp:Transcript_9154/g.23194  ORF Transcript_9154/g.23194 Transcript_9154/m.23194 type:complete len:546 (-) Transcript_9154:2010-3647(-)